jgi:hypothetical protein
MVVMFRCVHYSTQAIKNSEIRKKPFKKHDFCKQFQMAKVPYFKQNQHIILKGVVNADFYDQRYNKLTGSGILT